ncbi:hypothetical protein EDC94DRAFT_626788 [Helicostylum pulchrum]|nr:hypothetical protein EDC94DRAFT_626788 [Helicostylum pulchrum]
MMTSCWSMEDQSNSSNNSFVLAQEPSFIYQTQEEHAPPTQKNIPPQPKNKKIVFNNYHGRPAITSPTTKNLVCKILSNDHDSLQELPKRYICLICGKRFVRPGSLTTHTYSHTGEKPFQCTVEGCGRRFSVVSNLRRHGKIHSVKKNP